MRGGQIGVFPRRQFEASPGHAQRRQDAAAQRLAQRHAVEPFDQEARHVGGITVAEGRSRRGHQRQPGQPFQEGGRVHPGRAEREAGAQPGLAQRRVADFPGVGHTGGVAQQVAHRRRGGCRGGGAQPAQLGQVLGHRRVEVDPSFVD